MRGLRVLSFLVAFSVLAGCGAAQHPAATAAQPPKPPPRDPDLSTVSERYYQLVEGGHWPIAYGMFSARWRASHSEAALESMYRGAANADVQARQTGDRRVVTEIAIAAHEGLAARRWRETLTFHWDGSDWTIDAIAR